MQQPTDQRKDVPGQYLDIALVAGLYKIYCPAMAFDPPVQSVTLASIPFCIHTYAHVYIILPHHHHQFVLDTNNSCYHHQES